MSGRNEKYTAWFEKAEHDLLSIENNLAGSQIPWDVVAFHAQQAGEKYLKGFLVLHGTRPPKIHDLSRLLDLCLAHDRALAERRSDCIELTDAGYQSRYPDMPDEPGEVDARAAVGMAHRIRDAILQRVAPGESR